MGNVRNITSTLNVLTSDHNKPFLDNLFSVAHNSKISKRELVILTNSHSQTLSSDQDKKRIQIMASLENLQKNGLIIENKEDGFYSLGVIFVEMQKLLDASKKKAMEKIEYKIIKENFCTFYNELKTSPPKTEVEYGRIVTPIFNALYSLIVSLKETSDKINYIASRLNADLDNISIDDYKRVREINRENVIPFLNFIDSREEYKDSVNTTIDKIISLIKTLPLDVGNDVEDLISFKIRLSQFPHDMVYATNKIQEYLRFAENDLIFYNAITDLTNGLIDEVEMHQQNSTNLVIFGFLKSVNYIASIDEVQTLKNICPREDFSPINLENYKDQIELYLSEVDYLEGNNAEIDEINAKEIDKYMILKRNADRITQEVFALVNSQKIEKALLKHINGRSFLYYGMEFLKKTKIVEQMSERIGIDLDEKVGSFILHTFMERFAKNKNIKIISSRSNQEIQFEKYNWVFNDLILECA